MKLLFVSLITFLLLTPTFAQTLKYDSSKPTKEKRNLVWKSRAQCTTQNKITTDNQVELFNAVTTMCGTDFIHETKKRSISLSNIAGYPLRFAGEHYYKFTTKIEQMVGKDTTVAVDTKLTSIRFQNFGSVGAEIRQNFEKDNFTFRPFIRADYNFPTQTAYPTKSGFTVYPGLRSELNRNRVDVQNTTQLIVDSGSIIPYKRVLINSESYFYFRFNRMKVGPKFGYAHLLTGKFPKRNSVIIGMAFSYN